MQEQPSLCFSDESGRRGTAPAGARAAGAAGTAGARGTARGVRPVRVSRPGLVTPLALEAVHAGFPSVAQDYFISDFSFDENVITHPETTFAVRVAGDSMRGAGIFDGDLLLVDRSLEAQNGDVVIAVVDDELTVKRLIRGRDGQPVLHPENPRYPDITLRGDQQLSIWGVVIGNYHYQHREPAGPDSPLRGWRDED